MNVLSQSVFKHFFWVPSGAINGINPLKSTSARPDGVNWGPDDLGAKIKGRTTWRPDDLGRTPFATLLEASFNFEPPPDPDHP